MGQGRSNGRDLHSQARPETIHSKSEHNKMLMYKIDEKIASELKREGRVIASGRP